ncbi:MAG TPA: tRNA (adenosine(37)-N6)-dimethylallyltransferase MiaA [Clostridia bacterium]|nr:tRNA (adenosine(37)-N6)-dimethylallyltransferase MiaA [Clostridia bacterium]
MGKIPLVIILGPTAVGKTGISIEIAEKLDGEIISADSMQVYRYMDIGTAKPSEEERRGIPHYLVDVVYPHEEFNVSLYKQLADERIKKIHSDGKLPLVAGGTGLYINSLLYSMDFTEVKGNSEYRNHLTKLMEAKGKDWLHNELLLADPESANRLHPNDTRRIIRALEVHHITGRPISSHNRPDCLTTCEYSATLIGLTMERNMLYERIDSRVEEMLLNGLLDEVRQLIEMGYGIHLNSMQGLGYKEIAQYLIGRRTLAESIHILKRDTRRFAKRQFTWFRRLPNVNWVDVGRFSSRNELKGHLVALIEKDLTNKGV